MNWETHFIVNNQGRCVWYEAFVVHNEELKAAYRKSPIIQFAMDLNASMGVGVGQA